MAEHFYDEEFFRLLPFKRRLEAEGLSVYAVPNAASALWLLGESTEEVPKDGAYFDLR